MKTILALLVIAVAVAEINGEMMQRFGGVRRCSNKPTCAKGQKVKSYVIEGTTCPETEPIQQRGVRKQKVCQNVSQFSSYFNLQFLLIFIWCYSGWDSLQQTLRLLRWQKDQVSCFHQDLRRFLRSFKWQKGCLRLPRKWCRWCYHRSLIPKLSSKNSIQFLTNQKNLLKKTFWLWAQNFFQPH